eukprot:Skav214101  [mRNA]  locus=scaffold1185:203342:204058:- [translate_table: standard]
MALNANFASLPWQRITDRSCGGAVTSRQLHQALTTEGPQSRRSAWLLLGAALGFSSRRCRAESALTDEQKMAILQDRIPCRMRAVKI